MKQLRAADVQRLFLQRGESDSHNNQAVYGGFLKWGYPEIIIHFCRIFHYEHHLFWGTPIYGNPYIDSLGTSACIDRGESSFSSVGIDRPRDESQPLTMGIGTMNISKM